MSQSRRWCFTINNPTDEDCSGVLALVSRSTYLICGDEVGDSGTPHLQGYVVFPTAWRFKKLAKALPRARLAAARGTSEENRVYCSKSGKFEEYGQCPTDTRISTRSNLDEWEQVYKLAAENKIDEIRPMYQVRYIRALERIRDRHMARPVINDKLYNWWIWGRTGTGKTKICFDEWPQHYKKMKNRWWDDYMQEPVVVMQEFGKNHAKLSEHIKEWADHYPFRCEKKGSSIEVNFKFMIITSNYPPEMIWTEEEILEPLMRRFKVMNFPHDMPSREEIDEINQYLGGC